MNHKEKLISFLDAINEKHSAFCSKCGFSSNFLKSGKSFGADKLAIILNNYANLNVDWLLFDKGEMLLENKASELLVDEDDGEYIVNKKKNCNSCEEKDKQIAQLEDHIHSLKIFLEKLK